MDGHVVRKWALAASIAVTMAVTGTAARAQEAPGADLDRLIDASSNADGAVALARRQAADGDLTGAAATLERALFDTAPRRTVATRLYYISILCRLDDHERAAIETAKLGGLAVGGSALDEAQAACGPIQLPAGTGGNADSVGSGTISAGMAYDSDSYGALIGQFDYFGPAVHDDGFSFIGTARFDGRVRLGPGFLYGGLDGITKDSVSGANLDYQVVTGRAGYGGRVGSAELSIGPVGHYGRIDGDWFFKEYGGQSEIALAGERHRLALQGEIVHQDYANSFSFFSRNGTRYDLALDYQGQPRGALTYELGAAFEYKTARTSQLGYTGGRVFAAARLQLDRRGTYGGLSATVRHFAYRADFFGNHQIETRSFARAAIGTPLLHGVDIEAAGSYTRRDYNVSSHLLDYDSAGAELRLVWHFGG